MNNVKIFLTIILLAIISISFVEARENAIIKSVDISRGVNEFDRESLIENQQSTVLQNATLRAAGKALKRDGISEISDNTTTSTVLAINHFYKMGSNTLYMPIIYDSNMDAYNGTAWSNVFTDLTVSGSAEMFTAGDFLWVVSPNMATRVYNWTDMTQSGSTVNDPPQSSAGLYHRGRVLLWGNATNRDYLWWSDVGPDISDLLTFDRVANVHKIDSGDNQELVAVIEYGRTDEPGLVALKERSTYYIDTTDNSTVSNWVITEMFNFGCVARRTACKVGNDIYFLSRDGSGYKVRTLSRTQYGTLSGGIAPLSNPVDVLLSDIFDSYVKNSCAVYYDGYYILSFPSGSSTYNNKCVVYDTQRKAWLEWTGWTPSQFTTFLNSNSEELYYGNDAAVTTVYKALDADATSDDGTAITYQEESKQWDMGAPEVDKNWKDIEFEFTGQADNYYADIYAKIDEGGWEPLRDSNGNKLNLYIPTPTLPIALPFTLIEPGIVRQTYDLTSLGTGRGIKWKITNSDADLGSEFERLGVYLRGWINKQEWEGVGK